MGLQVPPPLPSPAPLAAFPHPSYAPSHSSFPDSIIQSLSQTYHQSLPQALHRFQHFNFVITDPRLPGHPIVFASDGFLHMTGYLAEEVLGRNSRFLQGPDTDRRTVLEIRDAIREERACQVTLLNYTKQGRPFWNLLQMAPLYSKNDGNVIHFVGVQTPVSCSITAAVRDLSNAASTALNSLGYKSKRGSGCVCQGTKSIYNVRESGAHKFSCIEKEGVAGTDLGQEQKCEVLEADKQNSHLAMRSLVHELAESSKWKGAEVTQRRCSTVAALAAGERVVCSSLMLALTKIQQSFVLSNPHLPGMPIVHASDKFLRLTGYCRSEVLGRNCRFLQGPDTDINVVQQIRECIKVEKACTVRILNYRKDKTSFWNFLHVAPVRSNGGKVAFFVGVQLDVISADEDECQKNGMTPHMQQLGAVGAIRVAVRSLQGPGLRRVQEQLCL
uniref:Putative LOV domain-containing protein n=1 Tax=Osmundastrum cinnamomeum TaxID=3284 RepID=A0A126X254_OSMCI|nr:putative LOV domain-containing protein [Osmundastrum cinnamomeum]